MVARCLAVLLLALSATFALPAAAAPKTKITWGRIEVPERDDAGRIARTLKGFLVQATKKTSFGRTKKPLVLNARLVEMRTEERGDVLRVYCKLAGRIAGGKGAISRITFGGNPKDRQALEDQVLKMVANGLVGRLAQIARTENAASAENR